jgi:DNA-binding Xre family transcriptional regulator
MALSYKKLWKLLIDRDMTRSDLHSMTGVSAATFAKMTKGKCISSSVIDRICTSLKCDVGDIMEVVSDKNTEEVS